MPFVADQEHSPLVDIINLSLGTKVVLEKLKEAVVVPFLKKPSLEPMDLVNYHQF